MIIPSPYPDVQVPETSPPRFVLEYADARGAAPAVLDAPTGRTLSYQELDSQVRRVAAGLRARGLATGDVLALCAPNGPGFVIGQVGGDGVADFGGYGIGAGDGLAGRYVSRAEAGEGPGDHFQVEHRS